jgi:hypothetical protein
MIQDIFHLYIIFFANFITLAMHKIIINQNYKTIFIAININLIGYALVTIKFDLYRFWIVLISVCSNLILYLRSYLYTIGDQGERARINNNIATIQCA